MSFTLPNNLKTTQRQTEGRQPVHRSFAAPRSNIHPAGLLVAGLVIVGLGVMAWTYLEPDIKRYIKISNM